MSGLKPSRPDPLDVAFALVMLIGGAGYLMGLLGWI